MGIGIIVCGLNGSGKSTLGKALAEKLEIHFIDIENLFFQQTASNYSSGLSRSDKEVEKILLNEVVTYKNFVFAAVKGAYGKDVLSFYNYAVLIDVPKEVRLERIKQRSLQKFIRFAVCAKRHSSETQRWDRSSKVISRKPRKCGASHFSWIKFYAAVVFDHLREV